MVTKSPTPNLLSKFGQLFRKPDNEDALQERSAESIQRAQVKHKRRNDAARANELNKLRRVIRDNRGIRPQEALNVASFASSNARNSGLGTLERHAIVAKIDHAQAHLDQWWGPGSAPASLDHKARTTGPEDDELDLDFTDMVELTEMSSEFPSPEAQTDSYRDSTSVITPLQSRLCDAALMYAEGEFRAAEAILTSLVTDPGLSGTESEDLCFALFEVYRCSGQQQRFEALALDYASRFGRSATEWFSLEQAVVPAQDSQQHQHQSFWQCPPVLNAQALADLLTSQPDKQLVSSINWLHLKGIDPDAVDALARQVTYWCENTATLHWTGPESLTTALQACRTTGDALMSKHCCLIQLDVLRIFQQAQAFEELALDYCVTFEESPPSWQGTACTLVEEYAAEPACVLTAIGPAAAPEVEPEYHAPDARYELRGNITIESSQALDELRALSHSVNSITVSCKGLGRIDIQTANNLMEWAEECKKLHREVQFKSLPRLVLVCFQMLGMEKWASLST